MKLDGNNPQIQRDASLLQMQMRKYDLYIETAHQILASKPSIKMYWFGLAVAYHLNKNHDKALKIIESYFDATEEIEMDQESSEVYLYRNSIIEQSLDLEACLIDLNDIESMILDRTGWQEAKG